MSTIIKKIASLCLIFVAIVWFVILISYNSNDPSFNSVSNNYVLIHNSLGLFGSYSADLLIQMIGYTTYWVVPLLLIAGIVLWNHKIYHIGYRILVFLCIIPFLSLLNESLFLSSNQNGFVQSGGIVGYIMYIGTVQPYPKIIINIFLFVAVIIYLWIGGVFLLRIHSIQHTINSLKKILTLGIVTKNQNMIDSKQNHFTTSTKDSKKISIFFYIRNLFKRSPTEKHVSINHATAETSPPTLSKQPFSWISKLFNKKTQDEAVSNKSLKPNSYPHSINSTDQALHIPSFLNSSTTQHSILPDTNDPPRSITPETQKSHVNTNSQNYQQTSFSHQLPPLQLLSVKDQQTHISQTELEEQSRILEQVLKDFGIKGEIISVRPGPVVTMFELSIPSGTKSSRVVSLAEDIARHMQATSCRISTIPGEKTLGIELPNTKRETFGLSSLLQSEIFLHTTNKVPIILGRNIFGTPVVEDLSTMPHLLVSGTTGSGKSVGINTFILSLLYRFTADECRFVMIDPKMLELSVYEGIPHLLTHVVTDPKLATVALDWVVKEMEDRYFKMSKLGVRNIQSYNNTVEKSETKTMIYKKPMAKDQELHFQDEKISLIPFPYIVVIVDEMADLMLVAGKEVEASIQRLAQMARAAGIHLIMATQRPSVDVITGTIKANFPSRISYALSSRIDSRVIIGDSGAEQLLGKGDMLYMPNGGKLQRLHGPFVSDEEVQRICSYIKDHNPSSQYFELESMVNSDDSNGNKKYEEKNDSIYEEALQIVKNNQKASTSYLQRRLRIGYNKAADIIERMEQDGYISTPDHVGKRKIFLQKDS